MYWDTEGNRYLGAVVLPRYGAFLSEEKCRLLEDMAGKKVLEIGCGNGQSLCYMGERGVSELWGLDLSPEQLERAKENLAARGMKARLEMCIRDSLPGGDFPGGGRLLPAEGGLCVSGLFQPYRLF